MNRFKTYKKKSIKIERYIVVVLIITLWFLRYYDKHLSPKVVNIADAKLEEVTNIYIKKNIVPKNIDMDRLIRIHKNNKDEIISLDIDHNYANELMIEVVSKIQNNIYDLDIEDNMLKKYDNIVYIEFPLLFGNDGVVYSNFGPIIPIKMSFYDHSFGNINVEINDYGINNAVIKVYLEIIIEQKLFIPFKEKQSNKKFNLLLATKIINGKIPEVYGGYISKNSELIRSQ